MVVVRLGQKMRMKRCKTFPVYSFAVHIVWAFPRISARYCPDVLSQT